MIEYTNYDPVTGAIDGNGSATEETFEAMIRHGANAIVDIRADPATHYVNLTGAGPVLTEYTQAEKDAIAALAPGWIWQMPERVAVDMRALEDVQAQARERINKAWISADSTSFVYDGHVIGAEPDDINRIQGNNGYISLFGEFMPGWPGVWKTKDNSYVPITDIATWKEFYKSFAMQGQSNFIHAQVLKGRIDAALTQADADIVQWTDVTT